MRQKAGHAYAALKQIGGALGLTAARTRQIEVGALDKLRDPLARPAFAGEHP